MSAAFRVEHLPTPLQEPEYHLQFLVQWDASKPLPYDAEEILRRTFRDALERLQMSRRVRSTARPIDDPYGSH